MNKHNILSRAEMKNLTVGGCPGWYQAQCIAEASSLNSSGDLIEDALAFDAFMDLCMQNWDYNPENT
ncbi:MAG: hypothetical protein EOP00_20725 [Pedobacter sp.]|nr:MAG: hypothetical protein EOP00_20725 [Pedobacter sp.]